MRRTKISVVLFAFILLVVTPAVLPITSTPQPGIDKSVTQSPSKVCHPKKPITCRASEFSAIQKMAVLQITTPNANPLNGPAKLDRENGKVCMLCMWVRGVFYCKSPAQL